MLGEWGLPQADPLTSPPLLWPKPHTSSSPRSCEGLIPLKGIYGCRTGSEPGPSLSLLFSILRAAQSGPPERPGPPQRALLMPGVKVSPRCQRR